MQYLHASPNCEQRECFDELAIYLKVIYLFIYLLGGLDIELRMRRQRF